MNYTDHQRQQSKRVIRVTMPSLETKGAFLDWCADHDTTPSEIIRHWIEQATAIKLTDGRVKRDERRG